jgi:hypothetical protein
MTRPNVSLWRRRLARVLDVAGGACLAIGLYVMFWSQIQTRIAGVRLSVSNPGRPFLFVVIALVLRYVLWPRHPVLSRLLRWEPDPAAEEQRLFARTPFGWRHVAGLGGVVIAFSAAVAGVLWTQVRQLRSVSDFGDPLFSIWRIAWIAHQVPRDPMHLFDGNMFYPERLTLTFSDSVLVPGLMSAPGFWLGGHPVVIYNLLLLSAFALSGATMFLLVRALTGHRAPAAVAGLVFALYQYRLEHYSHLELQMTMWMPLVLWGLHRTLSRGRLRDGIATGVAFALQMLSSMYYGLFLAVYLVPLAVTIWLARRRPWRPVWALAAGATVAAALIAPVAAQYAASQPTRGDRPGDAVQFYSATPADYRRPHFHSLVYGRWYEDGHPERELLPGLAPVALSAVSLVPPLGAVRVGYVAALAIAFDGSLGFNGVSFRWLRDHVGPFKGLRVPARFSMLVGLSLAVLSGFGAARVLDRRPRWRRPLTGLLLTLVVVDALPNLNLEPVWPEPPPIYAGLSASAPAVLAEFPMPTSVEAYYVDTRYLYFSTFHWQRLVNGNSGFMPASYDDLVQHERSFPDDAALAYLRQRGVEYIGVHGAFYGGDAYRQVVAALDARPDLVLRSAAPWAGSESRLYQLRR